MTAILFDGFDLGDTIDRWTSQGATSPVTDTVRTGTHARRVEGINIDHQLYLDLSTTQEDDQIYVGFGFYAANQALNQTTLAFSDKDTPTMHMSLRADVTSRAWSIWRGGDGGGQFGGTKVAETDVNVFQIGSWHYIECGLLVADSGGVFELRQDGVTILTFTGDTRNGGLAIIDRVSWASRTNGLNYRIDDVYILNEQGSLNNNFLGDTRVFPLYPEDNGNYSELVGSDADSVDNYLLVDEVFTPDITDYVASEIVDDMDTYVFEDLPVNVGTIRGVEVRMHASKSDTGTKQIRSVTRRGGSDSFGPDHVLAAIPLYQTHHDIQEEDPHAGPGAWTIPNVNDTEWGAAVRS
jgi:hypothetical protein